MKKFSEIIKELREEKGYNQERLASELNVSKSTVGMWETDKRLPGKELYEHIADLFNVDIDYLYGRTEQRKRYHFDNLGNEYVISDSIKENDYYIDPETREIAQEIFEDKDMRMLFDTARNTDPKVLRAYIQGLIALRDIEEHND